MFESLGKDTRWPLVSLGDIIKINNNSWVDIDNLSTYRILGVTGHGAGVAIKRFVSGSELVMRKYQKISADQLMWCKVDTKNGAFGVTKLIFEGTLASPNMCLADINKEICLPNFLQLFFCLPIVYKDLTDASLGTTNRQYLKPNELLSSVHLHLPPLDDQRRIVARIEELAARIEEARELRRRAVEETEALLKSSMNNLFTFPNLELQPISLFVTIRGGGTPSKSNPYYWEGSTSMDISKRYEAHRIK